MNVKLDQLKQSHVIVKDRLTNLLRYVILSVWAAATIGPLIWLLLSSVKTNKDLFSNPWGFPKSFTLENYVRAWEEAKLGQYFFNSVIVALAATFGTLAISAMAAYAFSRPRFRIPGKRVLFYAFIFGMMIPAFLILVPLFFLLEDLGLLDSRLGLILVYIAWNTPWTVFVLTGFFASLPSELADAALIDGCSEFGVFWRVMLPLAQPGLLTMGILAFLSSWKEYLFALVLIVKEPLRTLPVAISVLSDVAQYGADWVVLYAGLVIIMIPSLLAYLLFQGRIISGLTVGALKG